MTSAGDDGRTGWYPSPASPTPATVQSSYAQRFITPVLGQVYAQPVISEDNLIVATERDQLSALNPRNGHIRWSRQLGQPSSESEVGCPDLNPWVGITSTPVVDPATGLVYVMAYTDGTLANYHPEAPSFKLHAIDPATGNEASGFPVTITGSAQNDPSVVFNPRQHYQRPALLLENGVIYAGFGSHCDSPPYQGWVFGISTAGAIETRWTDEVAPNSGGGIWQAGGGLAADSNGDLIVSAGNGPAPPQGTLGTAAPGTLGSSIFRLHVNGDGTLTPTDFFTPYDAAILTAQDLDVGSGGSVVLPDSMGSTATPHLALAVAKSGDLFLLNRDALGGAGTASNGGDAVVARLHLGKAIFSTPALWPGNNLIYVTVTSPWGARALEAVKITGGASSSIAVVGRSSAEFSFGSGSPVVSSQGTAKGSSVVWVSRCEVSYCGLASLDAYAAGPLNGVLSKVGSWPLPKGTKYTQPMVANGIAYVAAGANIVAVGPRLAATQTATFQSVGPLTKSNKASIVGTLTISSTVPMRIRSVVINNPSLIASPDDLATLTKISHVTLATIHVLATPWTVQSTTAEATVSTSEGSASAAVTEQVLNAGPLLMEATVPIHRETFSLGAAANGSTITGDFTLTNVGLSPATIGEVAVPSAPFSVNASALVGQSIAPGATFELPISYTGGGAGLSSGTMALVTSGGVIELQLSGTSS